MALVDDVGHASRAVKGDHNFTTNNDMTPVLNAATHWEGALSGIRIDSAGPTWLMGTQSEHHRGVMYVC